MRSRARASAVSKGKAPQPPFRKIRSLFALAAHKLARPTELSLQSQSSANFLSSPEPIAYPRKHLRFALLRFTLANEKRTGRLLAVVRA